MSGPTDDSLRGQLANIERRLRTLEELERSRRQGSPDAMPARVERATPALDVDAPPPEPQSAGPPPPAPGPREPIDVEKWLRWAGLGLVILAVSFLVSVALDRGWLTPVLRVAGALTIGTALYTTGILLRGRSAAFATSLQAAGATVAYLIIWAAFQTFDLIPIGVAAVGLLAIISLLFWEVFRHRDAALGVLATLGGFAIPFLLTAAGNESVTRGTDTRPILAYLAVFVVLTAVVHYVLWWRAMLIAAVIGALTSLVIVWTADHYLLGVHPRAAWFTALFALAAIAYWLVPELLSLLTRSDEREQPSSRFAKQVESELSRAPNLSGYFLIGTLMIAVDRLWQFNDTKNGILAIALAVVAAGVAFAVRSDRMRLLVNGGLGAMLLAYGLAVLLDGEAQLIAFTLQAAIFHAVAQRSDSEAIVRIYAHVLTVVAGFMALGYMTDGFWQTGWPRPASIVVVIGATAFAATQQAGESERAIYSGAAYSGALLWIYWMLGASDLGQAFVTSAWAAIGLGVLVLGRTKGHRRIEIAGIATLGLVMLKLLNDLSGVEPVIRVFLSLAIGVAFLAGGWFLRRK